MTTNPIATTLNNDFALAQSASAGELMALAVARGARHYASFANGYTAPAHLLSLGHEALACALMGFPMPDGFRAFRCGVMVLSDPSNSEGLLIAGAEAFGIGPRIGYVSRLALDNDAATPFWSRLSARFPVASTEEMLPGLSRFVSDPGVGRHRSPLPVTWLRTRFRA